jgi:hypothetical protein
MKSSVRYRKQTEASAFAVTTHDQAHALLQPPFPCYVCGPETKGLDERKGILSRVFGHFPLNGHAGNLISKDVADVLGSGSCRPQGLGGSRRMVVLLDHLALDALARTPLQTTRPRAMRYNRKVGLTEGRIRRGPTILACCSPISALHFPSDYNNARSVRMNGYVV